ncbi:shufflon system plasmid conjugative transfer pilus tip adhesin PilV [Acetobacter fabarum]|jgi:hypothetical protein|uniref:shufflon system plasmid conjugative transfer pilus tip adhesin PilV n=1 Tax=Acetobacteraceae TaxID=433 RepID=UPI00312B30CD
MPSIIAALAAIMLALWPTAQYFNMVQDGNRRSVNAVTSGQFSILLGGVKKYIRAHSNDLINGIPVGSSTTVSLATLINEHDLPVGFTATNPYNQTWVVYISQSASGVLDGRVVSYNGQTLSAKDAVAIALKAGAQGGYVPPNGLLNGLNSNMAVGASGTWSQVISGFPNPGEGHLIGLLASADDANNNPNYLYRDAIAGHPELNTMETDLNMGGNNIDNAADVHAYGTVSSGNDTNNNAVNAYMSKDGRINATKDIRGQVFRPNYIAQSGTPCEGVVINTGVMDENSSNNSSDNFILQNGDIARDLSGNLLSCANGAWKSQKATISFYVPPTTNGWNNYASTNPITGTYSCPAGTSDIPATVLWFGDAGYTIQHTCY